MTKNHLPTHCVILLFLVIASCSKKNTQGGSSNNFSQPYSIADNTIYHYSSPIQLIGTNGFQVFGGGTADMNSWNIDIAREFIGNMKETNLSGGAVLDANNSYLHSMQEIVDSNRANNRITIFCAFGWDGTNSTVFSGLMPSQCAWLNAFKSKLQQWATYFKDQQDVWIEVWNEPYRYDGTDGYTDQVWLNDMTSFVAIIRGAGNNNIVLVPCAQQGQDESVLINKGADFLAGKQNILFDIHAYEKWLLTSNTNMGSRLQNLKNQKLPVIFGEVAPLNASTLMDPQPFLDSVYNKGLSVCAWVWKYSSSDPDALLDSAGLPNNNGNNNWGSLFQSFSTRTREP